MSPGLHQRHEAAALAEAPECGCTLANSQPNSLVTRSIASRSAISTILAAAVIALARQTFGVLVGQHRALRLQHRPADDVFRRDQLDLVALAAQFQPDGLGDFRIGLGQRGAEKAFVRDLRALGNRHCLAPDTLKANARVIHPRPAGCQPANPRTGEYQ